MRDCLRNFAFVSVHDHKSWFVAGVWTALDLWCLWLTILNWPMLTWRLQRKTQPTTPKPYKRHDLGVGLMSDVKPNRSWKIHHAGGVQRIMEGKLWDKIVCIFLVIWAEEGLWWLETSWNCRLGQILLVWASGESEAAKRWSSFEIKPRDMVMCHWAIQERLSSSKGNLLDAKTSKQRWAWFFTWKLALTKYHLIHLHIVEMIWTSFSICCPVVKGLKMRVTWCISCHFLSITSMNYCTLKGQRWEIHARIYSQWLSFSGRTIKSSSMCLQTPKPRQKRPGFIHSDAMQHGSVHNQPASNWSNCIPRLKES